MYFVYANAFNAFRFTHKRYFNQNLPNLTILFRHVSFSHQTYIARPTCQMRPTCVLCVSEMMSAK